MLLDSNKPLSERGRFDILVASPEATISFAQNKVTVQGLPFEIDESANAFDALNEIYTYARRTVNAALPDIPFCGGLVGYLSYDLGRVIESLPEQSSKDDQLPDMHFGLYGWAIIIDHEQQRASLIFSDLVALEKQRLIIDTVQAAQPVVTNEFHLTRPFQPDMTAEEYHSALRKIDDYIHAGDCYQVNFAQRFTAPYQGDPWSAYLTLRASAPTHYAAFIDTEHGAILSLSPERFLAADPQQLVITQPIKGTRPRGLDAAEDAALANALACSTKDQAENVMIVDLLRNDLSKVCEPHSVDVPSLFAIESYKNVHHLVSTVTGKLKPTETAISLLRHCFPGGSITGAPKIRAMEIIDELETFRRSIYCGSIGFISLCGNMDTSITIRTLLLENNRAICWAGGGIVADSNSADEYQETFDKVNNLLNVLPISRS